MNIKRQALHCWLFIIGGLILLSGLLTAGLLFRQANIARYPTLIADAYRDTRHRLMVPGELKVKLTRTGAYGIYFEHNLVNSIYPEVEIPPEISCTLTSRETGARIEAVPDYVSTNRYTSKDLHAGVLIMSLTVEKPGAYTFACDYQDGRAEPEILVTLGPNYFWEFLRVAWKVGLPLLGGSSIFCGSLLLALLMLVSGIIIKLLRRKKSGTHLETRSTNSSGP
jgi:hypothetical protein